MCKILPGQQLHEKHGILVSIFRDASSGYDQEGAQEMHTKKSILLTSYIIKVPK
jgi:hypothetical protein